jgi:hypothetical protein
METHNNTGNDKKCTAIEQEMVEVWVVRVISDCSAGHKYDRIAIN